MQTGRTEKITVVEVAFSEREYQCLLDRAGNESFLAVPELIHDLVIRSLKRKTREIKKGNDNET